MKIDGMDATNFMVNKSLPVKSGDSDVVKYNPPANVMFENKNFSQITEYEKKELPLSDKLVIEAIEKANKAILGGMRKFEFSIHEKTKQIMVKVIDSDTNEVIREIPPEKILDMVAKMWEMAGIVVDERR